jgi:hypothetical protein
MARLDALLPHKRLVFVHITRTSMTCTYVVPTLPGLIVIVRIYRIQYTESEKVCHTLTWQKFMLVPPHYEGLGSDLYSEKCTY